MSDRQSDETYTHGYKSAVRNQQRRTASDQGAFFTRHLSTAMRVLDCGCGPGSITVGLADIIDPGQVVGIDIGEEVIERANELIGDRQNVTFQIGSVYELPFPDDHFDGVLVHKVLEHVVEPETVLREAFRVLKHGGVIGTRSTDQGARNIFPRSEAINELFDNLQDRWQKNGGNPFFGRLQQSMMRDVGLERLQTTNRVEFANKDNWTEDIENVQNGDYDEWLNRGFLTEQQASDQGRMAKYKSDLQAFVADPDWAFITSVDYETVAWKPETV